MKVRNPLDDFFKRVELNIFLEKEKCPNCRNLHNGSIIRLDKEGHCLYCKRLVGGKKVENWEKEFDALQFQDFDLQEERYYTNIEKLKSYIKFLLEQQSKELNDIITLINKEK